MFKFKILPAILAALGAAIVLTAQASLGEAAAEACKTRPDSSAPRGSHWYYRIDRSDQRHCWFLGSADLRHHAGAAKFSLGRLIAARHKTDAAGAAEAASSPRTSAATALAEIPAEQVASAEAISLGEHAMPINFAARWPDGLPHSQDLNTPELATMRDSYADAQEEAGTTAQMPSPWPVIEAARAGQGSADGNTFLYGSLVGGLVMALLLLAGQIPKYARREERLHLRHHLRLLARRLSPRPPAVFAKTAFRKLAQERREGEFSWRPPTPTDPAQDLKASLAELMRDLRRAAAASDPVRPLSRVARLSHQSAYRHKPRVAQKEERASLKLLSALPRGRS